jgi:hypothetical protein
MSQRKTWIAALPLLFASACSKPASPPERRAELQQVGPSSVKVLPAAGQLPYCLLFTASERGVVRQLAPDKDASDPKAVPCKAGEPVGGATYRIPPREGRVRLFLLFSDQPLGAGAVAYQVHEVATSGRQLTAMDLRAPGQVQIETLEFTPSAAAAPSGAAGGAGGSP